MKTIVIDARESGTSTGRYLDKLVEYLHRLSPSFDIKVLTKPHRIEYLKSLAPNFEIINSPYKEFSFAEQLGLLNQIKKLNADLVHFGMTQQPILYRDKTVTTIHDLTTVRFRNPAKNWLIFSFKQWVYGRVIKRVAKKSARVITGSNWVKQDLAKYAAISPSKVEVTYEAADKITVPAEPIASLKKSKFIMYVGRPLPHKNLERLVEAFSLVNKAHPDLKLVLVGKKDVLYGRLERKVNKHKIPNVLFTGFASEGQLRWLYENTTAYVFPSLSEGFGLPALEAMAHGAPVISSSATCLPEVYGQAAHYFNPLDIEDMAVKIGDVLDNPQLGKVLVDKGQKQAAKYSWQKMATQTLAIYEEVLRN